jgi:hypothetical protein
MQWCQEKAEDEAGEAEDEEEEEEEAPASGPKVGLPVGSCSLLHLASKCRWWKSGSVDKRAVCCAVLSCQHCNTPAR